MAFDKEIHHIKDWLLLDGAMPLEDLLTAVRGSIPSSGQALKIK